MPRLLFLSALCAALIGCSGPAPTSAPPGPPPAEYSLDDLLGSGELRGFAIRPTGEELVASVRKAEGWSLATIPLAQGAARTLGCEPPLVGERLVALSPHGEVVVLRREVPGTGDRAALVARMPSGRMVDLSPAPGTLLRFLGWSASGTGVLVESDEGGAGRRDLIEIRLDDFSRSVRFLNDSQLRLGPLSPDGRLVAATSSDAATGPRLGVIELASGTLREIPVDGAEEGLSPQAFSSDGRSLFLLTGASGSRRVEQVALEGGRLEPVGRPCGGAVSLRLSPAGRYLSVDCGQGNPPGLVVIEIATGRRIDPPLPEGLRLSALTMTGGDSVWAMAASGARWGEDLFVWEPASGRESQLTYLLDPRLEARSLVEPGSVEPSSASRLLAATEEYLPLRTEAAVVPEGVLWVDEIPPGTSVAGGVHQPVIQYLANHGHRVLRLRLREAEPGEDLEGEEAAALVLAASARLSDSSPPPALVGVGRRAGRLALSLAARRSPAWSAVASLLPGSPPPPPAPADQVASPRRGKSAATSPAPDWIDALVPQPPTVPVLVVTADLDPALVVTDRERLAARLALGGGRIDLELLSGDDRALDRPGSREAAWAAVARLVRTAARPRP